MSQYGYVLLFSGVMPFVLSFWPPLRFWQKFPALLYSIIVVVVVFGAWDVFATFRGHWYFNSQAVGKIKIINLPLEEVLFFIVIPFCCIFTWEAIIYLKGSKKS